MSMRISTAAMHELAIAAMLRQQASLARTQNQIATGKRVQTPADDPVAAARLYELARTQSQLEQFGRNATAAQGRLQLEEQALADSGTVLQRVRELVVQANNATLSDSDRQSIVTELRSRVAELQAVANRQDSNGEYLFAGYASTTRPFTRDAGGAMHYAGDAGVRQLQIDATQYVADSNPGSEVFMEVRAGNGVFTTAAASANTGSGVLDTGSIVDRSQWVADRYTISFTSASTWQVTDGASNVVAAGNYQDGGAIAFRGVQVSVSGTPASGDTFTVQSAGTEDVFTTLDRTIAALQAGGSNDALRAQLTTAMGAALQQIDQASERLLGVRAGVGARLSMLDAVDGARQNQSVDLATTVSGLQDLDYATAVSKMSQQYVSLQAAQQSYASIAKLSLFNYL
jgi:flagellar hook-associated protein 3 FlgL